MKKTVKPLYTTEQRKKRDETVWTFIQGLLAPLQFIACFVSIYLVTRYLLTSDGYQIANISVLVKTGFLLTIMVTGAIWEKVVFGQYLFAEAFFWEDMVSMVVIALHVTYVYCLFQGSLEPKYLMILALVAYATYIVNAIQFILKLRQARKGEQANKVFQAPQMKAELQS
ncbi:2-vinyl bacteriochlorophyllide hydratase [Polynucleobacter kasalickyi]|uniref:3-vinyl bacteriochlorophyllide hydratase n=1 Tax=Polynucleobacter kasalickyi TaxID=1938817 RepID=A0A1W1Z280_9BURK|nr:2-vinyl bacteriochlorophyllide hydratase [Polynucleobacter kasalickyi]SMC42493.1 3-vinyl bacteriochlorophyllide hydratase [Polynucleobacter kasalickyi]